MRQRDYAAYRGSIHTVEAGMEIATDTANALNTIVEEISKAASLVQDISVASNEQATGIAQINQGVSQVPGYPD